MKIYEKKICDQSFITKKFRYHGNNMELLMKIYTKNYSHYYHLILLTKRAVSDSYLSRT